MRDWSIAVGSRTPTAAPAWLTLRGRHRRLRDRRLPRGRPLRRGSRAGRSAARAGDGSRSTSHLGARTELLASGAYRIDVPEEGALLVVAWLRAHGLDGSGPLLAILAPWMHALRFYPRPADGPRPLARGVRLQDVGPTVDGLDVARRQTRLEAQHAALQVWTPLRDRAMALLAATVDGPLPRLVDGAVHGAALGGRRPTGWDTEVVALAAAVRRAGAPPTRRAREVAGVVDRLARGADDRDALAADASLRRALACYVTAHGAPGSAALAARRADEARAVAAPLHKTLRRALVDRLSALPRDGGLALEDVMAPLDATEAARFRVPPGAALPSYFAAKVARSWDAPLDTLVDRGVIPSAEELARVVQQVTAQVRAVAFADPTARALYTALYAAFRARRGLLLLHYQHQVRLEEVPWIATLVARAGEPAALHDVATAVLSQVGAAAVRGFPHTIMPNKLIVELAALAGTAPTRLPFVEELAADIFMGSFTEKFAKSARLAAEVFTSTLYARYFAIDTRARAPPLGPPRRRVCRAVPRPRRADRAVAQRRRGQRRDHRAEPDPHDPQPGAGVRAAGGASGAGAGARRARRADVALDRPRAAHPDPDPSRGVDPPQERRVRLAAAGVLPGAVRSRGGVRPVGPRAGRDGRRRARRTPGAVPARARAGRGGRRVGRPRVRRRRRAGLHRLGHRRPRGRVARRDCVDLVPRALGKRRRSDESTACAPPDE
jgi:hypothetical protein